MFTSCSGKQRQPQDFSSHKPPSHCTRIALAQQKHHPRKKARHRPRECTRRPQLSMSKWTACLWHGPACPPRNASTRAQALFRACCHAPTCFVTYAGAPIFGQVQAHRPRPLEKFLKNRALVWMLAFVISLLSSFFNCFHILSCVCNFGHVHPFLWSIQFLTCFMFLVSEFCRELPATIKSTINPFHVYHVSLCDVFLEFSLCKMAKQKRQTCRKRRPIHKCWQWPGAREENGQCK